MKPKAFLNAAKNLNDYVSLDCTGEEAYICHALCRELGLPLSDEEIPAEYREIVELFKPTQEEYLEDFGSKLYLWHGYFGPPDSIRQSHRILACLFMYWMAKDEAKKK